MGRGASGGARARVWEFPRSHSVRPADVRSWNLEVELILCPSASDSAPVWPECETRRCGGRHRRRCECDGRWRNNVLSGKNVSVGWRAELFFVFFCKKEKRQQAGLRAPPSSYVMAWRSPFVNEGRYDTRSLALSLTQTPKGPKDL